MHACLIPLGLDSVCKETTAYVADHVSRIIIETCKRGLRNTEEEAKDVARRGQERILGGPDIHLGLA